MDKIGKAFRHKSGTDIVHTPYSMTWQLFEHETFNKYILEPAASIGAIIDAIPDQYAKRGTDILTGDNFLNYQGEYKKYDIITNPPYSLVNEFIIKAKEVCYKKAALLCQLNHLHGQKRYKDNIFSWLKTVYIFVRQANITYTLNNYYFRLRADGKYPAGCVIYAWFIFERDHEDPPIIKWIDNSKYILRKGDLK